MKKSVKKVITASMAAAMTLSASFALTAELPVQAATTVTFWHGWGGSDLEVLKDAIKKFEKANPGITIKQVQIPFDKLQDKTKTALMGSKSKIDMFAAPHDWAGTFGTMRGGVLEDMTKLKATKDALKDMKSYGIKAGKFRGKQIGFPKSVEAPVIIYNKSLVKKVPKTWDEFMKVAKAATKNGTYGLACEKTNYYFMRAFYSAQGGTEFTNEDTAANGFGGKEFVNFIKFIKDIDKSGILPKNTDANTVKSLFLDGKAAFGIQGPWMFGDLEKSKVKGKWGVMPYPTVNGKTPRPFIGVQEFYIPKTAKNKEEAAKFVAFMASPEIQKMYNVKLGHVPCNKKVKCVDWKSQAIADQAETGDPMPNIPEMAQIWSPVGDAMNKVVNNQGTPEAASKEASQKITSEIKKMRG